MSTNHYQKVKYLDHLVEDTQTNDPMVIGIYLSSWLLTQGPQEAARGLNVLEEKGYRWEWLGSQDSYVLQVRVNKTGIRLPILLAETYVNAVIKELQ